MFYFIFPINLLTQNSRIRALPPENITTTSFEARASEILSTRYIQGYVIDVALDSTFSEASFVPGYRRRHDRLRFSATTAFISELDPATTYYFRFVEIDSTSDAGRAVGFSNVQKVTTLDSPIPGSPKPALRNITRDGFTLRWSPVPKATYYLVDVQVLDGSSVQVYNDIITNHRTTTPTFSIENVYDSTQPQRFQYVYKVRAANTAGIGVANQCGGCNCIYTNPFYLRRGAFEIDSSLYTKWVLDAVSFGQLPQNPIIDSTYISLEVRSGTTPASILNHPEQEQIIDTLWIETDISIRTQLSCGSRFFPNPPFPPFQMLLHLKRKEDIKYFIQQYGRNTVSYTWNFVPSSPMFYRYSLVTTTSIRSQEATEALSLSLTPNPSADVAKVALLLPAPSSVRLTLHDTFGREVHTIADGLYPAGQQEFSASLDGLPSGMYFVRGNVGGQVVVRRLIIVR